VRAGRTSGSFFCADNARTVKCARGAGIGAETTACSSWAPIAHRNGERECARIHIGSTSRNQRLDQGRAARRA
jgi:hypothetical protein